MNKIFILRKENILPDFKFIKKINKYIWAIILRKVLKLALKKNLTVICNYSDSIFFENNKVKCLKFGDFISSYEDSYDNSREYSKKILESIDFNNKGFIEEEEFSYVLIEYLDNLSLLDKIKYKIKPREVYCLNSNFGKLVCSVFGRKVKRIKIVGILQSFYQAIERGFLLRIRFWNVPFINRIEFVKTGNAIPKKSKKRILVLGFDELFYSRIENLIKKIREENKEELIVLSTNKDTQEKLRKDGINFISFGDYLKKESLNELKHNYFDFYNQFKERKTEEKFKSLFYYLDYNFFDAISNELKYLVKTRIPWIILYYRCYKEMIKKEKIDYILTIDNVLPVTRSGILAGRELGVKSIMVQSGLSESPSGRGFLPVIADKIAVWGNEVKRYLENLGVNSEKIAVTGSIKLIRPKILLSSEEIYRKLNLRNKNPYIVIATQEFGGAFGEKEKEKFLRACMNSAKAIKNKNFIIKLHPRETPEIHLSIVNEFKLDNVKIVSDININELLNHSEGIITIFSTSMIEAMLLGKNSISLNLCNRPELVPYSKYNAIITVKNEESLNGAIASLGKKNLSKGINKFIKEYCCSIDGKSSERVLKVIRGLK